MSTWALMHGSTVRHGFDSAPVLPLVQEEARFLTAQDVGGKAQARFFEHDRLVAALARDRGADP